MIKLARQPNTVKIKQLYTHNHRFRAKSMMPPDLLRMIVYGARPNMRKPANTQNVVSLISMVQGAFRYSAAFLYLYSFTLSWTITFPCLPFALPLVFTVGLRTQRAQQLPLGTQTKWKWKLAVTVNWIAGEYSSVDCIYIGAWCVKINTIDVKLTGMVGFQFG